MRNAFQDFPTDLTELFNKEFQQIEKYNMYIKTVLTLLTKSFQSLPDFEKYKFSSIMEVKRFISKESAKNAFVVVNFTQTIGKSFEAFQKLSPLFSEIDRNFNFKLNERTSDPYSFYLNQIKQPIDLFFQYQAGDNIIHHDSYKDKTTFNSKLKTNSFDSSDLKLLLKKRKDFLQKRLNTVKITQQCFTMLSTSTERTIKQLNERMKLVYGSIKLWNHKLLEVLKFFEKLTVQMENYISGFNDSNSELMVNVTHQEFFPIPFTFLKVSLPECVAPNIDRIFLPQIYGIARAKFNFNQGGSNEISFKKGAYIVLLEEPSSEWCFVMILPLSVQGFVPTKYLENIGVAAAVILESDNSIPVANVVACSSWSETMKNIPFLDSQGQESESPSTSL